jgi:outer membrane protein assembly factor BamE (lipoprotein component of BamABCDE complex)
MVLPRKTVNALAALLLLGGCALFEAPVERRGHAVDAEQLAQLTPGVSTRADVQAVLGTPSASGTFDDDSWFYISSVMRSRPGRRAAIDEQRIVTVGFDRRGVVREVRELGLQEARAVDPVPRTTPSPGTERSFLQGLFGNIGRFGPGGPQQGGPGPGP